MQRGDRLHSCQRQSSRNAPSLTHSAVQGVPPLVTAHHGRPGELNASAQHSMGHVQHGGLRHKCGADLHRWDGGWPGWRGRWARRAVGRAQGLPHQATCTRHRRQFTGLRVRKAICCCCVYSGAWLKPWVGRGRGVGARPGQLQSFMASEEGAGAGRGLAAWFRGKAHGSAPHATPWRVSRRRDAVILGAGPALCEFRRPPACRCVGRHGCGRTEGLPCTSWPLGGLDPRTRCNGHGHGHLDQ